MKNYSQYNNNDEHYLAIRLFSFELTSYHYLYLGINLLFPTCASLLLPPEPAVNLSLGVLSPPGSPVINNMNKIDG